MNVDGVERSSAEIVNPRRDCTCSSGGPCFKHPYAPNGSYTMAKPGTAIPVGSPSEPAYLREPERFLEVGLTANVETRSGYSIAQRSPHQNVMLALPSDAGERKAAPVCSGVLDYFPAALVEVARLSKAGNDQHNPGQPLHWARGKSSDHADCIVRHLMQRGTKDTDGIPHSAKVAWRALALLQEELEAEAGFTPSKDG